MKSSFNIRLASSIFCHNYTNVIVGIYIEVLSLTCYKQVDSLINIFNNFWTEIIITTTYWSLLFIYDVFILIYVLNSIFYFICI